MVNQSIIDDQINSDRWAELCDYYYSGYSTPHLEKMQQSDKVHFKTFKQKGQVGSSGVIFCGSHMSQLRCLQNIPEEGNYILITRDNDNSVDEFMYSMKPKSVKHWFAINCKIKKEDVSAIPVGLATSGGQNNTLLFTSRDYVPQPASTKVYARLSLTPKTTDRERALEVNKNNPLVKIVKENVDGVAFYMGVADHEFTLAPIGEGCDCLRMAESIALGSIPILTECAELLHFSDMPVVFTRDYVITEGKLQQWREEVKDKSTLRLTMNHWQEELNKMKSKHSI